MILGLKLSLDTCPRRAVPTGALAVLVAALLLQGAASAQEVDLDALLSRAVELHQAGDLQGAAALYVQVLAAAPGAAMIRSNLGAAYAGLGRYEEAIAEYRKALEGIDDPSIRLNLVRSLQKAGRLDEVATEAERILATLPMDRDTTLLLADARLRLGEDQKAIDVLQPLARTSPNDKAIAYLLGTALLSLDRTAEAQVVMDRVFRDDSPESHVLMGFMLSLRRQFETAREELEKARAANPRLPFVNYMLASCLLEKSDWAEAAAALRRELEIEPNHFESNLMLGNSLRNEGRYEEALPFIKHAYHLRGSDLGAKFALGATYVGLGRLEEARSLLEEVAVASPNHLQTHMQLLIAYFRLGLKEDAAREREIAARLQKEEDARSFQGMSKRVDEILGRTGALAEDATTKPR